MRKTGQVYDIMSSTIYVCATIIFMQLNCGKNGGRYNISKIGLPNFSCARVKKHGYEVSSDTYLSPLIYQIMAKMVSDMTSPGFQTFLTHALKTWVWGYIIIVVTVSKQSSGCYLAHMIMISSIRSRSTVTSIIIFNALSIVWACQCEVFFVLFVSWCLSHGIGRMKLSRLWTCTRPAVVGIGMEFPICTCHGMAVGRRWIFRRRSSEDDSSGRICSYDMICDLACLLVVAVVAIFTIKYLVWGWTVAKILQWRPASKKPTLQIEQSVLSSGIKFNRLSTNVLAI